MTPLYTKILAELLTLQASGKIEDFDIKKADLINFKINKEGQLVYDAQIDVFIKPKKSLKVIDLSFAILPTGATTFNEDNMKQKDDLIKVFNDTKKMIDDGNQFEGNTFHFDTNYKRINQEALKRISVVNKDSVTALIDHMKENPNSHSCILNMASYKRPGGGVARGSKAQEEDLCRCSNLIDALPEEQDFYPIQKGMYFYSTDVMFFKDKDYNVITPIYADVVSFPAIDMRKGKPNDYKDFYLHAIRSICDTASDTAIDTLILGAWGCGVFKNDPEEISGFFKQVLIEEQRYADFDKIIFPVINDRNSKGSNYEVFKKAFS